MTKPKLEPCPACEAVDVHDYNKVQIFTVGWACRVCAYCGFFGEAIKIGGTFNSDKINWNRRVLPTHPHELSGNTGELKQTKETPSCVYCRGEFSIPVWDQEMRKLESQLEDYRKAMEWLAKSDLELGKGDDGAYYLSHWNGRTEQREFLEDAKSPLEAIRNAMAKEARNE